ncbi:unnamed protein product [Notodromas monacha]|uniref:Uncharacterized protein n=1 Tax=Notodromas monacha TaxID=399045 RepID=A0A7R9G7Q0_9CRUS|nr:unnamed protein product [Notodromas monacha]CAG0912485.1 unnamed protein product [Notodromas monacha]
MYRDPKWECCVVNILDVKEETRALEMRFRFNGYHCWPRVPPERDPTGDGVVKGPAKKSPHGLGGSTGAMDNGVIGVAVDALQRHFFGGGIPSKSFAISRGRHLYSQSIVVAASLAAKKTRALRFIIISVTAVSASSREDEWKSPPRRAISAVRLVFDNYYIFRQQSKIHKRSITDYLALANDPKLGLAMEGPLPAMVLACLVGRKTTRFVFQWVSGV